MRIVKLTAENVKRLRAVEITPDGNAVILTGKNGAGKSSVLDSIWYALGGERVVPEKPIRDGEVRASVVLDLGEYLVTRTWTANDKTYLKVEGKPDASGARPKFPSPQAILDRLVGDLTFNPLAFASMPPAEQRSVLLGLTKLDIDLTAWAAKDAELEASRRDTNREAKAMEARATAAPVDADAPASEVSVSDLMAELQAAESINSANALKRSNLEGAQWAAKDAAERLEAARQVVANIEADAKIIAQRVALAEATASGLADADTDTIRASIANADAHNARARKAAEARTLRDDLAKIKKVAAGFDAALAKHRAAKEAALQAATFPVPGLSITDDGVIYNGIPFGQQSSAEQLRVSLSVAMALNPQLRIIRIENGSLLDSDHLAIIEEMATAADFQLWIERVEDASGVGVWIEDGEVKS
ncbi:MAG: AAA family ATPase [bacterium]